MLCLGMTLILELVSFETGNPRREQTSRKLRGNPNDHPTSYSSKGSGQQRSSYPTRRPRRTDIPDRATDGKTLCCRVQWNGNDTVYHVRGTKCHCPSLLRHHLQK